MAEIHALPFGAWRAIRWTEAGQVLALAEMEPVSDAGPTMPPHAYAASLAEAGLLDDALGFTIHALPAHQAVQLACQCAREVAVHEQKFLRALEAAEAWAANPSEPRRRAAFAVAEEVGFKSAASFAALAAFWLGGSIAPENLHPVPAPRGLCGKAVTASARLAIAAGGALEGPKRLEKYLGWAKAMAEGREVSAA